jgi:dTDP-glucose 4,6-dehydratase
MRILIAGGAGFLGSRLVPKLLARGHDLVVVDSFTTGVRTHLAVRPKRGSLRVVHADVSRAPHGRYDRVYHLAAAASPIAYAVRQVATLQAHAQGTQRLLEICERSGARFLLTSSSEVYGDPLVHPQPETYRGNVDPTGPRSCYDEGKRFAEALAVAFVRERGVDARIVRIFNAYGPGMRPDDGRMPAAFVVAALRGEPIQIHGDGSQTRSLCYVDDTCEGLIATMERGRTGEPYKIGRRDEVTVRQFAELVLRLSGSSSRIERLPQRTQDVSRRQPDTRKARRDLGWTPKVPLRVGLQRTIRYYRALLGIGGR